MHKPSGRFIAVSLLLSGVLFVTACLLASCSPSDTGTTATPTPTPAPTPESTPASTPTATPETTPTATPEATPTATPEAAPTATPEALRDSGNHSYRDSGSHSYGDSGSHSYSDSGNHSCGDPRSLPDFYPVRHSCVASRGARRRGDEALDIILDHHFDVVLDIILPVRDGLSILRALRFVTKTSPFSRRRFAR